jgi:sulfate-transporting ATPase
MSGLWGFAVAGVAGGSVYALTALGIVLVYRGSSVLNFAQGAIGIIGAYVFYECTNNHGWPLLPAMILGVLAGALSYLSRMRADNS